MAATRSRSERMLLAVGGNLVRWLISALTATCRLEIIDPDHRLEGLAQNPRPVVLSFWHNRAILGFKVLRTHFLNRGIPLTIVASQSRDGQLVAETVKRWDVRIVRGSATRGGLNALRGIHRAIVKHGSSPVMLPDGPTGPLYHFKIGVAALAGVSAIPMLPIGIAASSCWRIRSWDRLFIPKPWSRIVVVVGNLEAVAKNLPDDRLEAIRSRFQQDLIELTNRAKVAAGTSNDSR